jgi:hypothetical protein
VIDSGRRSPRFRKVIFWVVAPLAVAAAVVLAVADPFRSPQALAVTATIDIALALLLLALWDPNRNLWAGRTLAAMIFSAYVAYLAGAIVSPARHSGGRERHVADSVVPALGGLVLIGWPALMFALFGRFTLRRPIDEVATPISDDDPLWVASRERARQNLPLLRTLQLEHGGEIAVKFPFVTDTGTREHVWGRLLDLRERDMWVTVITPPLSHKGVPPQHLKVPVDDLEDWQLDLPDGKIRGGFSTMAQINIFRRDGRVVPPEYRNRDKDFVDA